MTNIIDQNLFQLAGLWYEGSGVAKTITTIALLIAFSIFFFRTTGATGFFLWMLLCGGIIWLLVNRPLAGPLLLIPDGAVGMVRPIALQETADAQVSARHRPGRGRRYQSAA